MYWQGFYAGIAAWSLVLGAMALVSHVRAKRHNARIDKAIEGLDKLDVNAP